MTVISCSDQHINQCVDVHLKSFKGFFLTFLGRNFLKLLYGSIIKDPSGIGFVYLNNNDVIGFVFGSTQPAGLYRRLIKKRWLKFGFAALMAVIKKPEIIFRLFRSINLKNEENATPGRGTLMSIAVDPSHHDKNIGKELVMTFLDETRKRGCQSIDLTTDAVNNERVNNFYTKLNFTLNRTFTTPEGRKMNEYLINLD